MPQRIHVAPFVCSVAPSLEREEVKEEEFGDKPASSSTGNIAGVEKTYDESEGDYPPAENEDDAEEEADDYGESDVEDMRDQIDKMLTIQQKRLETAKKTGSGATNAAFLEKLMRVRALLGKDDSGDDADVDRKTNSRHANG